MIFRIDRKYRLPNSDLCLPRFGTEPLWRHLKHIHKSTFRVLDLEGFCQALGDASNILGFVENLKVRIINLFNLILEFWLNFKSSSPTDDCAR